MAEYIVSKAFTPPSQTQQLPDGKAMLALRKAIGELKESRAGANRLTAKNVGSIGSLPAKSSVNRK